MQLKRQIYYKLTPEMRFVLRKLFYLPLDTWETLTNKRQKYEPPKGLIYIGSGNFIAQGLRHLELLKKYLYLKPDDDVLDVGCGIGRTAIPLTSYLSHKGSYEGFDVVEKGVKWCNKKIKKDFPNFNFTYVPLRNDLYNNFKETAHSFKFPYEDNSFDKIFLFSVFTHMLVDEIANYLSEIKRVLKPGGLCLSTFFIYTPEDEKMISSDTYYSFPLDMNNYRLMSNTIKYANIALKTSLLDELIFQSKLEKVKVVEGSWKKEISNYHGYNFQDIVILKS